jgi:hypothetical protein
MRRLALGALPDSGIERARRARLDSLFTDALAEAAPQSAAFALLAAPYETMAPFASLSTLAPPLGSVVISSDRSSLIAALAQLTLAANMWPWVVPCVLMPDEELRLRRPVMIITELRDRLVIARAGRGPERQNPDGVLSAVRERLVPTASVLARWVSLRLGVPELKLHLGTQFREALEDEPSGSLASVSTYSRFFASLGPLTARDWRGLARLCVHLARRGDADSDPLLPRRTAEVYTRKHLGMRYCEAARYLGWEWVLEKALRQGGYLSAAKVQRSEVRGQRVI